MKKTKIICTLGPKSDSKTEIKRLVQAGMDIGRLNFSHGNYEHHAKMIHSIRKVSKELKKEIPIIVDLQGPKIRLGKISDRGLTIKRGQIIVLTTHNANRKSQIIKIPIQYNSLPSEIKTGESILIDDGLIELLVLSKNKTDIKCKVIIGGKISSNKGINVPDTNLKKISTITNKDKEDLKFVLKFHPEYVALSFTKNAQDIADLKKFIEKELMLTYNAQQIKKKLPKIIAKIECQQGVNHLEEITEVADELMVARGDLAVEVGDEKVPILQQKIINLSHKYGKTAIVATQMLSSMVNNPRPTRAEVSDIATAVFENADKIMLSNESSVGKFAVKAVQIMTRTIKEVEKYDNPWR